MDSWTLGLCVWTFSAFSESKWKHRATLSVVGWLCMCLQGNVSLPAATASAAACFINACHTFSYCMWWSPCTMARERWGADSKKRGRWWLNKSSWYLEEVKSTSGGSSCRWFTIFLWKLIWNRQTTNSCLCFFFCTLVQFWPNTCDVSRMSFAAWNRNTLTMPCVTVCFVKVRARSYEGFCKLSRDTLGYHRSFRG